MNNFAEIMYNMGIGQSLEASHLPGKPRITRVHDGWIFLYIIGLVGVSTVFVPFRR